REDSSAYNLRYPYIDILIDEKGLWCGRADMGFIYYDRSTKKTRNFSLLSSTNPNRNSVNAIRADHNDTNLLWLGTQDGIYSFNKKTYQLSRNFRCSNPRDSMEGDINLLSIDMGHTDTIWFGSREGRGIGCYDMKTGEYTIYPLYPKESEKNSIVINSM